MASSRHVLPSHCQSRRRGHLLPSSICRFTRFAIVPYSFSVVVYHASVHLIEMVLFVYLCIENESRDLSAVISSLSQLMMDPYFRTINGFQSLVQKEWITLGHPFTKRFGRITEFEDKRVINNSS